jgi:hypothetical protein
VKIDIYSITRRGVWCESEALDVLQLARLALECMKRLQESQFTVEFTPQKCMMDVSQGVDIQNICEATAG